MTALAFLFTKQLFIKMVPLHVSNYTHTSSAFLLLYVCLPLNENEPYIISQIGCLINSLSFMILFSTWLPRVENHFVRGETFFMLYTRNPLFSFLVAFCPAKLEILRHQNGCSIH